MQTFLNLFTILSPLKSVSAFQPPHWDCCGKGQHMVSQLPNLIVLHMLICLYSAQLLIILCWIFSRTLQKDHFPLLLLSFLLSLIPSLSLSLAPPTRPSHFHWPCKKYLIFQDLAPSSVSLCSFCSPIQVIYLPLQRYIYMDVKDSSFAKVPLRPLNVMCLRSHRSLYNMKVLSILIVISDLSLTILPPPDLAHVSLYWVAWSGQGHLGNPVQEELS